MGKENDCVNLFAHRFLAKRIRPMDRIGIEVAVPQLTGKGRKQAVRKDLVIWKRSGQTTWSKDWKAKAVPQAILEWKVKRGPAASGARQYSTASALRPSRTRPPSTDLRAWKVSRGSGWGTRDCFWIRSW